jgi:formate dehydrogenase maturation protein FdhE
MGVIVKSLDELALSQSDPEEAYLKDPNFCPYCGADVIEAERFDVEGRVAWQAVRCNTCEAEWNDVYELVAVEKLEQPLDK